MLLLLLACTPVSKPPADDSAPLDTGATAALSDDPCERVRAGPGADGGIIALSEAHADVRLFGAAGDFATADAGLIAALDVEDPASAPDLDAYAAAVEGVCVLDADPTALGAAAVEQRGGVWWVTPGTGDVSVPDDGAPVALDLRGLPATGELDAALRVALAAVAVGDVSLPNRKVRAWNGLVDQVFSASNAYSTALETVPGDIVTGTRTSGVLYVVTEARLAPAAAELAGAVALGGHGHIVGADVLAAVSEMVWSPVGDRGLAWRGELLQGEDTWPDVVPAALRTDAPEEGVATLDPDTLAAPALGGDDRSGIKRRDPWEEVVDTSQTVATYRAALVISHGMLRRFYPYFDVVGDDLDARLLEVLADPIDPTDIAAQRARLGRLGNVLSDGHMFTGTYAGGWYAGFADVSWALHEGLPVVADSAAPGLDRGDTVVAVDGVPITSLRDDWLAWHGGATDGYRLDVSYRELWYLKGDTTFTLRDPDGVEEDVVVTPTDGANRASLDFAWYTRPNGTLDDFGYPEIAYLDLASEVTTTLAEVEATIALAEEALIVDMRGYPGVNHYEVMDLLVAGAYASPQFRTHTWTGPGLHAVEEEQYALEGDADAYTGTIVLLVSPVTVSAAENFSQMLVGAGRVVAVVGSESSAGTNGNITGVRLPGGYYLSFTGMEVRNPDGSEFHGQGIRADLIVNPTPADLRDGRDAVLEAAVDLLTTGSGAR
jgi:C-terminal processing protease CtpA/Prc